MPSRVKKRPGGLCAVPAVLVLVLAWAASAVAAPPRFESDSHRWIPAFSFATDMVAYGNEAATAPTPLATPFGDLVPQADSSGGDTALNPHLALGVELSTPGLEDLPGDPRFFVRGDVAWAWPIERKLTSLAVPSSEPFDLLTQSTFDAAIAGQGALVGYEMAPWQIGAGAGLAFTFEAASRRFRVKTSVEYLRHEIRLDGVMAEAIPLALDPTTTVPPEQFLFYEEFAFAADEVFHGLGGGFELESDMGQGGPFIMTLFFSTRIYGVLSDTSREHTVQRPLRTGIGLDSGLTGETKFSYDQDPLMYRAGVGFRFRYSPE